VIEYGVPLKTQLSFESTDLILKLKEPRTYFLLPAIADLARSLSRTTFGQFKLNHGPSTGEINRVPSKQFLAVSITNCCINVVIVKYWAVSRIGKHTPGKC
jgi:hypothetical protein